MTDGAAIWADLIAEARAALAAAGIEPAEGEARRLIAAVAEVPRTILMAAPDAPVARDVAASVRAALVRRVAHEPLSRIVGRRGFWTLDLLVTPDVLDPRPETELLVEAGLEAIADDPAPRICDLGTGSGAILLAMLTERTDARGLGIDVSPCAVAVARRNAAAHDLADRAVWAVGRWGAALRDGAFDLLLSNPPYIAEDEVLGPEVAGFDPPQALFAGPDGLADWRVIMIQALALLRPGGWLIGEHGWRQGATLRALARAAGFQAVETLCDLEGRDRAIRAQKPVGSAEKSLAPYGNSD